MFPMVISSAPSLAQIEHLALEARAHLPDQYFEAALRVSIHVAEIPDAQVLADLDVADIYGLTGAYIGVPLAEKTASDQQMGTDAIWLFRRPILDEYSVRGDVTLSEFVTHIVAREFAHHFGWSKADVSAIDHWWE